MDNVTAMVVNLGYMTATLGELGVGEEPVWHPKPPGESDVWGLGFRA
jgi:hypothetical protein